MDQPIQAGDRGQSALDVVLTFGISILLLIGGLYVGGTMLADADQETDYQTYNVDWTVYENRTAETTTNELGNRVYTDPWLNLSDPNQHDWNRTDDNQTYENTSLSEVNDEFTGDVGNVTVVGNDAGTGEDDNIYIVQEGEQLPDESTAESPALVVEGTYEENGSETRAEALEGADWGNAFVTTLNAIETHISTAVVAFSILLMALPAIFVIRLLGGSSTYQSR